MKKIPLIYILSNGRSGSTILDMLLGSFPGIWTLGEAQLLPLELNVGGVCGTGETIRDAAFWKDLVDTIRFEEEDMSVSYFRRTNAHGSHTGAVLRRQLLEMFGGRGEPDRIERYGRLNYEFFARVIQHAEAHGFADRIHWLVDASKDPYRLMWLQRSGYFDIRVIHLTKQPPAFVYSTARHEGGKISKYMVLRMTLRWIIENAIMKRVCDTCFLPTQVYPLAYETLANDAAQSFRKIGEHFNIDLADYAPHRFREYANYGISGNKSRWENAQVRLDEKWKTQLPKHHQYLVSWLTRPFIKLHRA